MDEPLHPPDFTAPDFAQPELQAMKPGFTLPNPAEPDPPHVVQLSLWPADPERMSVTQPDPDSPDLTELEIPANLTTPSDSAHIMSEPGYAPDSIMDQRPGELDPSALEVLLGSPDHADLSPDLSYPHLYIDQDEMSRRKRHLGMLDLGLERDI